MALRFKKQYENQTVALADGMLVDKNSLARESVQAKIKGLSSLAYMFEEAGDPVPPVTGGGGAGDPRKPKTETTASAAKKSKKNA